MKKSYDRTDAKRLVPLLRIISVELADRLTEIQLLDQRIETLSKGKGTDRHHHEIVDLQARVAVHNREIRMAKKELERLGCVYDESVPSRILIPGRDGNIERGFSWDAGDGSIHRVTNTVG